MFKRLFWMTVGAALGVGSSRWAARVMRRQRERWAPEQVANRAAGAVKSLRTELAAAAGEGLDAMRDRETRLRAELASPRPLLGLPRDDR